MSEHATERRPSGRWTFVSGTALGLAVVVVATVGLRAASDRPTCEPIEAQPGWSVARRWDEAVLDAIRRALPAPTVHARNLFHLSAAMWDAWAAYDPDAAGYFVDEEHTAADIAAARNEAISYAAYRLLHHRYRTAVGGTDSLLEFERLMEDLCYPTDVTRTEGASPAALGNRIAAAAIESGLADGSNEAGGYTSDYAPVNAPLEVAARGPDRMEDPNRWQPLQLEQAVSQNGIPIDDTVQQFLGPHWGFVTGFALPDPGDAGVPMDPGPPPLLDPGPDDDFKTAAVEVIDKSGQLDPGAGDTIDISPGALGANALGTNDGEGHAANPVTGQPYVPNVVNLGDFTRALTEFWADGSRTRRALERCSERVSDSRGSRLLISGAGPKSSAQWDVSCVCAERAVQRPSRGRRGC
jgi:hypothetical protein